jgi:hypothetical protein
MLREWTQKEEARREGDAAQKAARRAQYGIGWKFHRIPRSVDLARQMCCDTVPQGMCCLVADASGNLKIGTTLEPAASVNLAYFSSVLRVRLLEGREPYFSLDEVKPDAAEEEPLAAMQAKRIQPEWLAGTGVGEALFQADYHLKELSMGECHQPVVGMKSSLDFSEAGGQEQWAAREWFVVRDARVQKSEDNVLMACVKMGVEAREQVTTPNGVEDAPITWPDHPLVKYADEFTHYFDLIAERKSVFFHLRELAKAATLAKCVTESALGLEDAWFGLREEVDAASCLEVPQLWHERLHSQIQVQDGKIVNEEPEGHEAKRHLVYGGVHFGLERFQVQPAPQGVGANLVLVGGRVPTFQGPTIVPRLPPGATLSASIRRGRSLGPGMQPLNKLEPPPFFTGPTPPNPMSPVPEVDRKYMSQRYRDMLQSPDTVANLTPQLYQFTGVSRVQLPAPGSYGVRGVKKAGSPAGVDLALDSFDLADTTQVARQLATDDALEESASVGQAFWESLDDSGPSAFRHEDQKLLVDVFNPRLSDRRDEGESFVPPETGFDYVQHLRSLVKEEEVVQERRKHCFLSQEFLVDDPGSLFPSSWKASFGIDHGQASGRAPAATLHGGPLYERPDYTAEARVFEHILKSAAPEFDKSTEDGSRFRIYRLGGLEIRTVQEQGGQEVIGTIFSMHPPKQCLTSGRQEEQKIEQERVVKATLYVEGSLTDTRANTDPSGASPDHHMYAVFETGKANMIVTELAEGGAVTWEVNPRTLDARSSLAKVFSSSAVTSAAPPRGGGLLVSDLKKRFQEVQSSGAQEGAATPSSEMAQERYAQMMYLRALG